MHPKDEYKIEWSQRADLELSKLPKDISARIVKKIDSIISKPFHFLEHYEG